MEATPWRFESSSRHQRGNIMSPKTPLQRRFLKAMQAAYPLKRAKPRSPTGLKPIHGWVRDELNAKLRPDLKEVFTIASLSETSTKEETVKGQYYDKKVDILISADDEPIGIVSIKFIISNYCKNSNNYFEQGMGETANLRRRNIVYGHLFFLTNPIPKKIVKRKKIEKVEKLRDNDIRKYHKLRIDHEHLHVPHEFAFGIVDLDIKSNRITGLTDPSALTDDQDLQTALKTVLSLDHFFGAFALRLIQRRLSP